jgi:hypothetical protein
MRLGPYEGILTRGSPGEAPSQTAAQGSAHAEFIVVEAEAAVERIAVAGAVGGGNLERCVVAEVLALVVVVGGSPDQSLTQGAGLGRAAPKLDVVLESQGRNDHLVMRNALRESSGASQTATRRATDVDLPSSLT